MDLISCPALTTLSIFQSLLGSGTTWTKPFILDHTTNIKVELFTTSLHIWLCKKRSWLLLQKLLFLQMLVCITKTLLLLISMLWAIRLGDSVQWYCTLALLLVNLWFKSDFLHFFGNIFGLLLSAHLIVLLAEEIGVAIHSYRVIFLPPNIFWLLFLLDQKFRAFANVIVFNCWFLCIPFFELRFLH